MKLRFTHCTLGWRLPLLVGFLLAACTSGQSDEQIQKNLSERMSATQNDNNKKYSKITPVINEGVVTLNGECQGENCADSAAALVRDIEGVKDVVNNVKEVATETDYTLRGSVQGVISNYAGVQADVAAGVIVLRGQIERAQLQPLMNELSALNPKKIDNQLAVK
jgi:hyperosmotically inducible protein